MKPQNIPYAQLTKFSDIFEKTYWGAFSNQPDAEIISNRNKFVQEYKITKYSMPYTIYDKFFNSTGHKEAGIDHVEGYITSDKDRILVTSPYGVNDTIHDELIAKGWSPIYKLYNASAVTYIKRVPMRPKKSDI